MKVSKLNGQLTKLVSINVNKYRIDWDKDGSSSLERRFRDLIRPFWKNSIILYQCRIPGSLLRLDFLNVNKRLLVETDGEQHNQYNKHFNRGSRANYLASIKRDLAKEKWCQYNAIQVLHLDKEDLDNFSIGYVKQKYGIELI